MQDAQPQYVSLEEYRQLQQAHQALQHKYELLVFEWEKMRKLIFGAKSERFVPGAVPNQLSLEFAGQDKDEPLQVQTQKISYDRKKHRPVKITPHGRLPLPAWLPRRSYVIEPGQDISGMKCIGQEISEELDYRPGAFWVNQYVRPKYVAPAPDQAQESASAVVIAPMPSRPVEKGIASAGLLAHVIVSKTADHLPLYRQSKMWERQGLTIPPATLTDWFKAGCDLLAPLYQKLRQLTLGADYLQMDESPIKVLQSDKPGKAHQGYMWVCRAPVSNLVFFSYNSGRTAQEPEKLLTGFKGTLQSDGYSVYEGFENRRDIILAACWSHARRKFTEAMSNDQERAEWMLGKIQDLYKVERKARDQGLNPQQRLALRQEESRGTFDEIETYLKTQLEQVLPKSPIGKAIGYALGRWKKLERFLHDGRVEIDTNMLENKIRPLALGRKNYLFAGNHEAAQRLAIAYSLMASCQINALDPHAWLRDVLFRMPDHPLNRLDELLPHLWKPLEQYPPWFDQTDSS